ncbi:MAG: DUF3108 domain-containing protein [Nitrospinae bacterium]|nr:DUF3108 domain-containing protein [Nitrospinota bacterium]
MTRKRFFFILAFLALTAFLKPRPLFAESISDSAIPFKTIDYFFNEKADYDISFLWFDKAAEGSFQFMREDDGFKAVLQAETKGFIGFLTSYRKHVYISHLVYVPEKGKLRARVFERNVVIGDKTERTITYLDYGRRLMEWEDYKGGKLKEKKSQEIPAGMEYEDILSAFLNFRLGVYGPIERERKFSINTIPEKGQAIIDVNILSREAALKLKSMFGKDYREDLMPIKVKVPKEIFKSKTGEVAILMDDRILPIIGVVENYIGFGDIRAVLRTGKIVPAAGSKESVD